MNCLWAGMMLIAIVYGALNGTIPEVTQAALDSSKEAVSLCITMLGILSFWMGLMQIGTVSGLIEKLTRGVKPFLCWLFPRIPKEHPALEQIALNCIANMLGLGWAATPAGLKAMEELKSLEENRRKQKDRLAVPEGTASDEMCTFLVINISSLQLIPVNVIAYRSQYGSVDPTAIVGPVIAATLINTLVGVIVCKVLCRK
ncbi:MAG: nucleoside recognition protein [Lachnospiraceae bacterium]|nr:nucleoside recognition protein [Lachnospiraceae bacterium]